MKLILPKFLFLSALILFLSTVSEPLLSYADTNPSRNFEDDFF
ncbi:hypothetical protein MKX67_02625 [Cytobacillus sp. FSL W7-1323]|nr:hypothetical protein [Cytobacillus sp. OWB-43]